MIPELSGAINGVLWMFAETPVLILEGQKWSEDGWDGGNTFTLSMYGVLPGYMHVTETLFGVGSGNSWEGAVKFTRATLSISVWVQQPNQTS